MLTARRTLPRKISAAVLANLRESLVPLVFTTVTPSFYLVYLHPEDFAAIESIVPLLRKEIARALADATSTMAHPRWWSYVLHPAREVLPSLDTTASADVEILPDPDGDVPPGEIAVHSELRMTGAGEFAGSPTVRVTTTTSVHRVAGHRDVPVSAPAEGALAWLQIDDMEGVRRHAIVDNPTLLGRGGLGCYVHVRLRTEGQVSKEHCRIRRDDRSGEFFIKDLSRNGTSVNGSLLPKGVDVGQGGKRELDGGEMPLPDGARIGLADVLFLEFTRIKA
jgi:hypothetical protein